MKAAADKLESVHYPPGQQPCREWGSRFVWGLPSVSQGQAVLLHHGALSRSTSQLMMAHQQQQQRRQRQRQQQHGIPAMASSAAMVPDWLPAGCQASCSQQQRQAAGAAAGSWCSNSSGV